MTESVEKPKWSRGQWVKFTYPRQDSLCFYKIRSVAKKEIRVHHVTYCFNWDGFLKSENFRFAGMHWPSEVHSGFFISPLTEAEHAEYIGDKPNSILIIKKLPVDKPTGGI